jgi:hypothetical protein
MCGIKHGFLYTRLVQTFFVLALVFQSFERFIWLTIRQLGKLEVLMNAIATGRLLLEIVKGHSIAPHDRDGFLLSTCCPPPEPNSPGEVYALLKLSTVLTG